MEFKKIALALLFGIATQTQLSFASDEPNFLIHVSSGKCLAPTNNSFNPNKRTQLVFNRCDNSEEQQFRWLDNGSIQHVASGRCIKPEGPLTDVEPLDRLLIVPRCGAAKMAFKHTNKGAVKHIESSLCIHPENGGELPAEGTRALLKSACGVSKAFFEFSSQVTFDSDNDGVDDAIDQCPNTPAGVEVDSDGCEIIDDADLDGVPDSSDACPFTPAELTPFVDASGCFPISDFEDFDGDSIVNINDRCPDTPRNEPADINGCALSQQPADSDGDGVPDEFDFCPFTPPGIPVDANGCQIQPRDSDGDGLTDDLEISLGTDIFNPDSDFDRLLDGDEVNLFGTNPLNFDTDFGGVGDGDEINQNTNPLDASDDLRTNQLPLNLTDALGFNWDIQQGGEIADGTQDAFDGGFTLNVNNNPFFAEEIQFREDNREVRLSNSNIMTNLKIERRIFVPQDRAYARFIDSFKNSGNNTMFLNVNILTNLGSDGSTTLLFSDDGDQFFSEEDRFLVTDDDFNGGPISSSFGTSSSSSSAIVQSSSFSLPPITSAFSSSIELAQSSSSRPVLFSSSSFDFSTSSSANDTVFFEGDPVVGQLYWRSNVGAITPMSASLMGDSTQVSFSIRVRPGETISLVYFGLQSSNANLMLETIDNIISDVATSLTDVNPQELLNIANWFDNIDSDGDGLLDDQEILFGTDPLNPDSNFDGRTDAENILVDFNPELILDLDQDGVVDFLDRCIQFNEDPVDAQGCPVFIGSIPAIIGTTPALFNPVFFPGSGLSVFDISIDNVQFAEPLPAGASIQLQQGSGFDIFSVFGPENISVFVQADPSQSEFLIPIFIQLPSGERSETVLIEANIDFTNVDQPPFIVSTSPAIFNPTFPPGSGLAVFDISMSNLTTLQPLPSDASIQLEFGFGFDIFNILGPQNISVIVQSNPEETSFAIPVFIQLANGQRSNTVFVEANTFTVEIVNKSSVFVHNREVIEQSGVTLTEVFNQLAVAQPSGSGSTLFRQFWDAQRTNSAIGSNINCVPINGFPISCDRAESEVAFMSDIEVQQELLNYDLLAFVNRIELRNGWQDCGEHRMVFGRNDFLRNFLIFEARMPNPIPGDIRGCEEIIRLWDALPNLDSQQQAMALRSLFIDGVQGHSPAITMSNFTEGEGQIRTNQFITEEWMLREYDLAVNCEPNCRVVAIPVRVNENPFGELFSPFLPFSNSPFATTAADFQAEFASNLAPLLKTDIVMLSNPVRDQFNNGHSHASFPRAEENNFAAHFGGNVFTPFGNALQSQLEGATDARGNLLSIDQLLNRATAMTCGGCHEPQAFGLTQPNSIGAFQLSDGRIIDSWPNTLGFVHVDEFGNISPALSQVFIPERLAAFNNVLNELEGVLSGAAAPMNEEEGPRINTLQ